MREHYAQANCRYWVFEEAALPGAFLEFSEAPMPQTLARAHASAPDRVLDPRASTTKWSFREQCRHARSRSTGRSWQVIPSGYVTQYDHDEFGLMFIRGTGPDREVRVTRYSPHGARSREQSLAELTDADLARLFEQSQPSDTSPEAGYTLVTRRRRGDRRAFVDLHMHSTASDGSRSPAEVVRAAKRAGLAAIALTDHDTMAGLAEAAAAGAELGVRVVPASS